MFYRDRVLNITNKLKEEISNYYKSAYTTLFTIPGVGSVTAMGLLAEIGDLTRFKNPYEYVSYLGLIPSEHRSGDTTYGLSLQPRCNMHLPSLLIEAAWRHVGRNNKKAIVKVA